MLRNPYFLGGPQRQAQGVIQKWLPHPCLVGGPQEGGSATEPLHSRGSPAPSAGRKSVLATSPPPSEGPGGGDVLCNPGVLGGSQHLAQGEIKKWLPHPCLLQGPQEGGSAT